MEPTVLACLSHDLTGEARDKKAVFRDSCFVKNLKGRVAGAGGLRLVLPALSRTSPRHVVRKAG